MDTKPQLLIIILVFLSIASFAADSRLGGGLDTIPRVSLPIKPLPSTTTTTTFPSVMDYVSLNKVSSVKSEVVSIKSVFNNTLKTEKISSVKYSMSYDNENSVFTEYHSTCSLYQKGKPRTCYSVINYSKGFKVEDFKVSADFKYDKLQGEQLKDNQYKISFVTDSRSGEYNVSFMDDKYVLDPVLSGCGTIDSPGVYTLDGDINSTDADCISIVSSDVVLDCQGYTISQLGSPDSNTAIINGADVTNITVQNCNTVDYYHGFYFGGVSNLLVENTTGEIEFDPYNYTDYVEHYCSVAFVNTSFNGLPIYLFAEEDGITVKDKAISSLYFCDVNNSKIDNLTITSTNSYGVFIDSGSSNIVSNSTITSTNNNGVYIYSGSSNIVSNSTITSTDSYGFFIESGSSNIVSNSTITAYYVGVYIDSGDSNNVSNSTITSTNYVGVYIYSGSSNIVSNSTITCGNYASVTTYHSPFVSIKDNTLFCLNSYGIYLDWADFGAEITGNNIIALTWIRDDDLTSEGCWGSGLEGINCNDYYTDSENCLLNGCNWTNQPDVFNDSYHGNIYYYPDGTPSWMVYDIRSSTMSPWADNGTNRPFDNTLSGGEWIGSGQDWQPYTENTQMSTTTTEPPTTTLAAQQLGETGLKLGSTAELAFNWLSYLPLIGIFGILILMVLTRSFDPKAFISFLFLIGLIYVFMIAINHMQGATDFMQTTTIVSTTMEITTTTIPL